METAATPDMVAALQKLQEEIQARTMAELQYQNLFSKMLDGFALHEIICRNGIPVDYRFLNVNPAFETLTGLAAKDILGKTACEVIPTLERHWIDIYGKVALRGEPINCEQYAAELDKHFQIAAYCPAPGQFACIFQDITMRKKAEQEKADLETQLRHRHKMEAIGTLAGGIAHDFNNILGAVIGYADIALRNIPTWNPAHNQIQEVLRAGNRAKNLVRQILAFSREETKRREPVDLHTLIIEVVAFLRATIPTTIDILLDIHPDCGNVLGDQTQIHQVLMNLCTNAGQAMQAQGGTLTIALRDEILTGESQAPANNLVSGPYLRLDIGDTGEGIPAKHLDRIFDPYFTTKAFGTGSGMGLAVVHGIVKSHNGYIKVVNNIDRGTTFSVFFPRIKEPVAPIEVEKIENVTGSERILVVDDDPSIAKMLGIVLRQAGYSVQVRNSSLNALEVFSAAPHSFDLLITDMTMPDMTGDKLAMAMRRLRPALPIILCTGYSSHIDEVHAQELGIEAYLLKPLNLNELLGTVRRILDK